MRFTSPHDSAPAASATRTQYKAGLFAETICCLMLMLKGYRILARRYRTPLGEIDIVALRGRVLAIIEVKARPSLDEGAGAIGHAQQQRLQRAVAAFLTRYPRLTGHHIRFDAMLVAPRRLPAHIMDAWRPDRIM